MTMEPHFYELKIVQGATLYEPFAIEDVDETTMDLAAEGDGYTIGELTVMDKPASEGGVELLVLTTDNGGVVIEAFTDGAGRTWSGYWFASAAATAALVPWGDARYDFEIRDSAGVAARVERPFFGTARLLPEVTT